MTLWHQDLGVLKIFMKRFLCIYQLVIRPV